MNGIFSIEFSNHLVAALLHTLWQGAAIAGVLWIVLCAMPARQANARYGACVVALLAMVIAFSITWDLLDRKALPQPIAASVQSTLTISSPPAEASAGSLSLHEIAKAKVQKPATIEWMRVAAMAWVGGVVIMMLRAMRALVGAGRLRRRCVPIEAPAMVLLLDVVRSSMRIARRVKLAASEQITSPAVIGILWPTILLPASVISGTDAQTLRMILAHELAHVRRHDYLVNLFQLLIEAILFFNPAVWWISRQIRIEREACCDARAIASGATPSDYVRALAGFAQGLAKPQAAVMSMSGNQQPGGLLDRVRRALAPQHRPGLRLPWYSLTGSLIVGALVLGSVWRTSVAAVELAEKLLTPEERIAKAKEAQKEYSQGSTYRGKMNVVGTVKTADGKKLPRGMYISLHVTNQGSSMGTSERVNDKGEFRRNDLDGGVVTITVAAPGYAPAFSGPVTPDENGKLDPINLVLEPGFIATFHVTDENGTPVNNALIGGGFVKGEST
jgi:beta-lactamase regulating signal transducer with metallopeptidase domain